MALLPAAARAQSSFQSERSSSLEMTSPLPPAPPRRPWTVVPQIRAYPPDAQLTPGSAAPEITAVRADVAVRGREAATEITVGLRNPTEQLIEAELLLPVPSGAIAGRDKPDGPAAEILGKREARAACQDLVGRTRDPALLEFYDQDLLRSRIFPIPPEGTQTVRLRYAHKLVADGSRIDYLLPRSDSLESRLPWQIQLRIEHGEPLAAIYSPSHEIDVRRSSGQVSVRLRDKDAGKPGSFRLSWLECRDELCASLLAFPEPPIHGGYCLLLAGLRPGVHSGRGPIRREVTLVLDHSGSMNGEKMRQVRSAARRVLEGLSPGETFNLIAYNEAVDRFAERPVARSADSLRRAGQWLDRLVSRGGTNIHAALQAALQQPAPEGALPIVLFLTDGLPTVGQTSERAIRALVQDANRGRRRIFTFGVGVDVNTPLLESVASTSRAFATFVLPGQDVEASLGRVFAALSGPLLADLRLELRSATGGDAGQRLRELIPERLPDLFEGGQLVVVGQYRGSAPLDLALSGEHQGRRRVFRQRLSFAGASRRLAFVPRLWASRKIALLVDTIRSTGADADRAVVHSGHLSTGPRFHEHVSEVVRLSRRYGILTEYTAFLAAGGASAATGSVQAKAERNFVDRALRTRSGLSSVNQELNIQQQATQQVLNPTNRFFDARMQSVDYSSVQQVADLAFFRQGERWIDSRVDPHASRPDRAIRFASPGYWRLVDQLTAQGRCGAMSLRGEILLSLDDEIVLIEAAGTAPVMLMQDATFLEEGGSR